MKMNRVLLILGGFAVIAVFGIVVGGGSSLFGASDVAVTETTVDSDTAVTVATTTARDIEQATATTRANTTTTREAQAVAPSQPVAKPGPLVLLNPALGAPGSAVSVSGSGFDGGAVINVTLKKVANDKGQDLGFAQADEGGSFGGINFNIPDALASGTFLVVAQQDKSDKSATATGQVQGSSPSVKFGTQVGKPGDRLTVSAKGFAPGEKVNVYFNSIGAEPVTALQADQGGALGRASITVPYGASGNNSFILMGEKSQSPVTVQFLMLNFYPAAGLNVYAAKPDTAVTFNGSGFGPSEKVSVFLNSMQTPPVSIVDSGADGAFTNAGQFIIPFSISGKNIFIFVGDKSQAAVTAGFDVLPYTPYAEASTYGARAGTTITFYGRDFARNEVVRVYVGRAQNSAGTQVSCFQTDDRGGISGGGGYTIPHDAQAGKTTFALIGDRSKSQADVAFQIMDAGGPVPASPDEAKQFHCPFDDQQSSGGQTATQPALNAVPAAQSPQQAPSNQQQAAPQSGSTSTTTSRSTSSSVSQSSTQQSTTQSRSSTQSSSSVTTTR